ncbi:tyrosine-type recombinase/integrase [Vibrio fluvialis]|nr:tyrosine-type recombinase/integrase [Vibrio fluvialis]
MALTIRNGIYYAQKKIPNTNRTVRKSLNTRSKREAIRIAGVLDSISEVTIQRTVGLPYTEVKRALVLAWQIALDNYVQNVRKGTFFACKNSDTDTKKDVRVNSSIEQAVSHKSGVSLNNLYQQWMLERLKEQTWTEKTTEDIERKFKFLFKYVSPKTDVSDFGNKQAIAVKVKLLEKELAVLTLNKYLQAYSSFFKWIKQHGYISNNPFEGISLKETRRAQEQREAFAFDFVPIVLQQAEKLSSGSHAKNYYKWIPLIAAYSGMRLNEICQLYKEDIQEEDGIKCFVIDDKFHGQRLKTPSAKRIVPIHHKIVEAGFFDYIESNESDRCFPELASGRDGYGKNASRWFNERLMKKFFPKSKCVFHSFRHTVADKMMKSDVDKGIAKAVLGHAEESETFGRYAKGYSANQLKRAIDKLNYSKSSS